jgi:hypothetical protein
MNFRRASSVALASLASLLADYGLVCWRSRST